MIATAFALQLATQNAVQDITTMEMAKAIYHSRNEMSDEDFAHAMFIYTAHLASLSTTLAVEACLTKEQINEMMGEITQFDSLLEDLGND